MATLIELENRVKKLEERSSIQDETIKRMFEFVQRAIDDQVKKFEEGLSIQDETIKRIFDFIQRVIDDQYEKKATYGEHMREEDEQLKQESERLKRKLKKE